MLSVDTGWNPGFYPYSIQPAASPHSPTSLLGSGQRTYPTSYGQPHEGAVWVEDPPPEPYAQPQVPTQPPPPYGVPQRQEDYRAQPPHGEHHRIPAYAQQYLDPHHYLVPPSQHPHLVARDYRPPSPDSHLKRRRLNSDAGFSHPQEQSGGWDGIELEHRREGGMLHPARGTAARPTSDSALHAWRRSSAFVPSPASPYAALPQVGLPAAVAAIGRPTSTASAPVLASPSTAFLAVPAASPAWFAPHLPLPVALPPSVSGGGMATGLRDVPAKKERSRPSRADESRVGLADKSCKHCRVRKVRCSRTWPVCHRCTEKELDCHYGNLVPIDLVKSMQPEGRVAELEARIKSLEQELAISSAPCPSTSAPPPRQPFSPTTHTSMHLPTPADLPLQIYHAFTLALGPTLNPRRLEAHTSAVFAAVRERADSLAAAASVPPKLAATLAGSTTAPSCTRLAQQARADAQLATAVLAPLSPPDRAQHPAWPRLVVWSLLDACWKTCSSNVPAFLPFHDPERKARLLAVQRELLARAMRTLMMDLYDRLEIAHGEGSKNALAATIICGATMMWNELLPCRSRSLVRDALGHYRALFDATSSLSSPSAVTAARTHLLETYALPLLHQDSTIAVYLRAAPLISASDLKAYFPAFLIPTLERDGSPGTEGRKWCLHDELLPWFDVDRLEGANHRQLLMGSMVIYTWLAACLRWCAEMSCARASTEPLSALALTTLFSLLEQIHTVIQTLQHYLVHAPSPVHASCVGPDGDTCTHVHLRWCTRLDREADDCVWLAFATVGERLLREERETGEDSQGAPAADVDRVDIGWLQTCEAKVREGLKRAAFYFNFFTISPDPHQTHHLAWSLELAPSWTFLAAQRYTPSASSSPASSGPRKKSDELTETELDWIERGLEVAQQYHPVAERRLVELRAHRQAERRRIGRLIEAGEAAAFPSAPTRISPARAQPSCRPPSAAAADPDAHTGSQGRVLDFQQAMREALAQTVPSWA